ncbi:MAG: hypothetical protein JWO56_2253, partial [Acidobacteria bacterium]|nr:hypothetical protein [Acidobacteriota bacterium]
PIVIGLALVVMAALAVFTGLRYREPAAINRMANGILPHRGTPRQTAPAPPGEPAPGASLVFPGDADNVPKANEPVQTRSRAQITGGGAAGVVGIVRMDASRGMQTKVTPDDALVYVNDLAIGEARQFNTPDEIYDFAAPGSYTIRIVAPGYRERTFVVNAGEGAKQEIARIEVKLEKQ